MQAHAKVWLISVALGCSGCARGAGDLPEQNPVRQNSNMEDDDPYGDVSQHAGARNANFGGQSGKGGAPSSLGGSAGHAAGSAGSGGTAAGGSGSGASAALAGAGNSGTNSGPSSDCPSLTRVRLPSGLCADRIQEFSLATTPTSIVTGSDGQIWFDDDGVDQLVQIDSEGRVLKRIDCNEGSSPRALVGGRDDTLLWYTDAGKKQLNRVTQTSQVNFELKFTATDIALGEDDQLWLTEAGQAVYQVRPYVSIVPYPDAPSKAIVVGPDQNVWFPTAGLIAQLIPGQGTKYFSIGAGFADELCTGPDGALWFSDGRRHQIGRMEPNGKSQTFDLPFGSGPSRIIAGPDGALWFTAEGGDKIGRITVKGDITQYPIPTNGGVPYALTVGGDRNIWFTERSSGKIGRLIPDPLG